MIKLTLTVVGVNLVKRGDTVYKIESGFKYVNNMLKAIKGVRYGMLILPLELLVRWVFPVGFGHVY